MKKLFPLLVLVLVSVSAHAQNVTGQEFHANGRLKSTRFTDGVSERFITYYESGRVKEMGQFREGRRDGTWKQFAENGALLARAEFVHGQRAGTWEYRDASNGMRGMLHYSDGRLAHGEEYAQGELIAQRNY